MSTDPNEAAYPCPEVNGTYPSGDTFYTAGSAGMSIREVFAKTALQGIIAAYGSDGISYKDAADSSVAYADALIAALNERKK